MGLENPLHIAFILILVLLVFGAKRLPEMGRSLGSGMRGFRDSLSGETGGAPEGGELNAAPSATSAAPSATSSAPSATSSAPSATSAAAAPVRDPGGRALG
jgi:sec-independent protein translocase protein TatA